MSKPKQEYDVTVLSRTDVTTYPKLNVPVVSVIVTYVAAGLPPRSISILKREHTSAKEKELIRKDIEARLAERPESFKV